MKSGVKGAGHVDFIERIYHDLPTFSDVFNEETFYVFVVCFVLATILVAFVLSRFITIKPVDDYWNL